ncbi:MAG: TIGR03790 family protein [Fimbriimonadaceae bacterium]|nr:TIGR03790 family protein [Fimbriimonadaceae bacterium]
MAWIGVLGCVILGTGCEESQPVVKFEDHPLASQVLVVQNDRSPASKEIAGYYAERRGILANNRLTISVDAVEEVNETTYREQIEAKVRRYLSTATGIHYIVLTKGVPLRIRESGNSVDAMLAAMEIDIKPIGKIEMSEFARVRNPYFGEDRPFRHDRYGLYLVTRLDGYTTADAKALVDRAIAAKPDKGPFLLDASPKMTGAYDAMNRAMATADGLLTARGFQVQRDDQVEMKLPAVPVMGYVTWGSNDPEYSASTYRAVQFRPGALGETFVSTSGRTFLPATGGQSLIADLVKQGITGVKGYVSEPFLTAMARPDILFDRYTRGYNLAESYYMASPVMKWKDVVIGDPLCAPYPK